MDQQLLISFMWRTTKSYKEPTEVPVSGVKDPKRIIQSWKTVVLHLERGRLRSHRFCPQKSSGNREVCRKYKTMDEWGNEIKGMRVKVGSSFVIIYSLCVCLWGQGHGGRVCVALLTHLPWSRNPSCLMVTQYGCVYCLVRMVIPERESKIVQ